jgi:hypothetical protein
MPVCRQKFRGSHPSAPAILRRARQFDGTVSPRKLSILRVWDTCALKGVQMIDIEGAHPAFDKSLDMYNGNLFLLKYLPEPEGGFYYLTCSKCNRRDSWSFKSTSPTMFVDYEDDCENGPVKYPTKPWVCDNCKYPPPPIRVSVSPKKRISYKQYLQTEHWKEVRQFALNRAKYRCQTCSGQNNLNVHHNTYRSLWKEKATDVIVLCEECHVIFHKNRKADGQR